MYLWLKFTYIKHFLGNKKVLTLAFVAGMDPECHYALGSLIDGIAIWFTANACLCSRQALALLISSYVCLSFSPFIFLLNKSNHYLALCSIFLLLMLLVIWSPRTERPEEWVPGEVPSPTHENNVYGEENGNVVDIFSIHSNNGTGAFLH